MTTDPALADASNTAFVAMILLYAVAMFGYAVEYAFARRAKTVAAPARELVTAGGGTGPASPEHVDESEEDDDAPPPVTPGVSFRQAVLAGRIALVAMVLGAVAHAASLGLRAAAVGRWPWGNMYEFIVAVSLVGVIAWIAVVAKGWVARRLSLFAMLATVLMLGAATRVYTEAAPLVPALDSYWIAIHVFAAIVATGVFMVGFVTVVLQLISRRYAELSARDAVIRFPMTLGPRLPLAEKLDRITWRLHVMAFPLWTFAIIAGAIWARESWGRYWGWDPKEVWSFVAWVVYAAYLHSRATGGAGRRWAPWIAVVGWAVMLFNLFGVNLFIDGLHSYAGV
ncbi:cytochrome c-type biogenesis protein CcsB [Stackebrandtia albiflava]|uniref:Cytochrome c-type biogenesis protein CcsB n=1 Tax=Stackebrandtia albiflava TaxID=406432 RepID=A0A562V2Q2_9ACTN|nr:c-type cytochrome biogenesis protein CcsB [Stackebrandtia albiflava]TWJ12169.1 cytochrome c-type biogenesis protein CcsB [Stackebrandtia albiflava]